MAQPPPELQRAIDSSAKRYGVPASTLTGIWQIESGSSYPNPYVNSEGYGGLFGTRNWNAPTQAQADTSASILANLLRRFGGNMTLALEAYSGGGYGSVPGSPGQVPVPAAAPTFVGGGSTITTQPARPGMSGSGESFWDRVWGSVAGSPGQLVRGGETLLGGAASAAEGGIGGTVDFLKAAVWLLNPLTWLRAVEALFGFVLLVAGVLVLLGADKAIEKAGPLVGAAASMAE